MFTEIMYQWGKEDNKWCHVRKDEIEPLPHIT